MTDHRLSSRLSRQRWLWLPAAAVLLWLLGWWAWTAFLVPAGGGADRDVYVARGYLRTVDLYLRHDWLRYDPAAERIYLDPSLAGTAVEDFYRGSYLAGDVAAFNGGDRSAFRIENGRVLALDPYRHNIALPFASPSLWKGRLTFRPETGRRAELAGDGARVLLATPTIPLVDQPRVPEIVLPRQGARRRRTVTRSGQAVNLRGDGGLFFGKVHMVGDGIVFNDRQISRGAEVSISGQPVPTGNRSRLDSGDLLKLRWRLGVESHYSLLWASVLGEAPVISAYRAINGRWQRTPATPDPPFTADVVSALDAAFQRRGDDGRPQLSQREAARRFDLALTLDAKLQAEVQERLERYARGLRDRDEPPFRAAVTVMDATRGDVLALASFPTEDDLAGWTGASGARNRLLRNHNFSRLPIGSVAKVMLAAAAVDDAPFLLDLEIPSYAGGEMESLLGLALDPVLKDHSVWGGEDGWIGFEEFIEKSSNKYAAMLVTLAAGVEEGTGDAPSRGFLPPGADPDVPDSLAEGDRFRLAGGAPYTRRPGLLLPVGPHRDPATGRPSRELAEVGTITTAEHLGFAKRLREVFGVPVSSKNPTDEAARFAPGSGDDLVDTSAWQPLLAHLYGADDIPFDHPFYGVSPERANLALNLVDDYRRQYLSIVLGGGSSTWTNPEVARFFAQLITGQRVRPNLVRRIRPSGSDGDPEAIKLGGNFPVLDMDAEARRRLGVALTRVAGPGGTARGLRDRLRALDGQLAAQGETLGFFSKTGSPDNVAFVPTNTGQALDELIRRGALRLDGVGRVVYRDHGPVDADATDAATNATSPGGGQTSLQVLLANPGDMAVLARWRVSPRTVVRVADTWNDALPVDRTQFEVEAGRLVRALNVRRVESIGGAYAFVLAAYDAAARPATATGALPPIDVTRHAPKRALAVSIVIESQGNGPDVAVPFAEELLDGVLEDALLEARWEEMP